MEKMLEKLYIKLSKKLIASNHEGEKEEKETTRKGRKKLEPWKNSGL
jgi:hypothetical protein